MKVALKVEDSHSREEASSRQQADTSSTSDNIETKWVYQGFSVEFIRNTVEFN